MPGYEKVDILAKYLLDLPDAPLKEEQAEKICQLYDEHHTTRDVFE